MGQQSLLLGADGGGTKTLGILSDNSGKELCRAQVGASNPNVVGVDVAAENLADLLVECCRMGSVSPANVGSAVFGLAGAGNTKVQQRLLDALAAALKKRSQPQPVTRIVTDARVALEGAFAGGPGIILIAGTGSAVLGKTPDGTIRLVGGWGRVVGDEGSGYWIGVEALRAVAGMMDRNDLPSKLRGVLDQRFGLSTRERLVNGVYQEGLAIPTIAPVVLESASEDDPAALEILRRGATHLADQTGILVGEFDAHHPVGVVFVGGLIDHDTIYARLLRKTFSESLPRVEVRSPLHSPAEGALLLARQLVSTE